METKFNNLIKKYGIPKYVKILHDFKYFSFKILNN